MRLNDFKTVNRLAVITLLTATILTLTGCNHLPRGKAPKMNTVFDRFDKVQIGKSTSADVFSFIQNKSMDELISQDEQTVVSWGQNGTGAVIWLNAVSFDQTNNQAARKYALLIDEDSPGWGILYLAKSKKLRAEFEFVLPAEFDELEFTNENERRREALKTAISLYLKDINVLRFDSDYVYISAMLLRHTFNELLYELERVPAYLTVINEREGVEFTHPTMGKGKVRMVINNETFTVRIKVIVGSVTKGFATDEGVIAMDSLAAEAQKTPQDTAAAQGAAPQAKPTEAAIKENKGWFNWFGSSKPKKPKYRSPEELQKIEDMAKEKAAADIAEMKKQVDEAVDKSKSAVEQPNDAKPAIEQPAVEQPAEAKPAIEQPADEKPAAQPNTDAATLPIVIPTPPAQPAKAEEPAQPQQPVMEEAVKAQTNP